MTDLPCKLVASPPDDFEFDYFCKAGPVDFSVGVLSGGGSAAFAAVSIDGQTLPLSTPMTVRFAPGAHVVRFVIAFSSPVARGVILEACNPGQRLKVVDAAHPLREIRVRVS